jgi:hypothetical protein
MIQTGSSTHLSDSRMWICPGNFVALKKELEEVEGGCHILYPVFNRGRLFTTSFFESCRCGENSYDKGRLYNNLRAVRQNDLFDNLGSERERALASSPLIKSPCFELRVGARPCGDCFSGGPKAPLATTGLLPRAPPRPYHQERPSLPGSSW